MSIEFGFERRRRRFFLGIVTLFGSSALPRRKLSVRSLALGDGRWATS